MRFKSLVWLLILGVAAWGLSRLKFDVEVLELLPNKSGVVQGLKQYQSTFLNARELIIAVQGSAPEETEKTARELTEKLRQRTDLVRQVIWQPLWKEKPQLASEFISYLWLNQPPHSFSNKLQSISSPVELKELLGESRELLAASFSPDQLAKRAYDPLQLLELPQDFAQQTLTASGDADFFTSPDGLLRMLFVEASVDLASYRDCRIWLEQLEPILATARSSTTSVHITGRPVFVNEIASGMENDMSGSCTGTLAIVGLLFYLAHRRFLPMVLLLASLLVILVMTLACAGFVLGSVNVISIGFAAILAGLAEDFGIVIYEEVKGHPSASVPEIRKIVAPGIFWSAVTTAGAFALLNFSSLPGLAQLGALISTGVLLAAVLMIFVYLPVLKKIAVSEKVPKVQVFLFKGVLPLRGLFIGSILAAIGAGVVIAVKPPSFDLSPDALRPKASHASQTLELIKRKFGGYREPVWVIVTGKDEDQVQAGLAGAETWVREQQKAGLVQDYNLPSAVWPNRTNQIANKQRLMEQAPAFDTITNEATLFGFTADSLNLAQSILLHWSFATNQPQSVFWPTNELSHFILGKFSERTSTNVYALGLIHPASGKDVQPRLLRSFQAGNHPESIQLSGWPLLGIEMFNLVWKELPSIVIVSSLLVLLSLWLTFRTIREVILSVLHLGFSLGALIAGMSLLGIKWNLMNLLAFPLLLGLIVDFSIHMQLSLRRLKNRKAVQQTTGRALLLAGTTTMAGFFSLGFSSNLGLATLGMACGFGTLIGMVSAVFLLPAWSESGRFREMNN